MSINVYFLVALALVGGVRGDSSNGTINYEIIPNPRPGLPEQARCLDETLPCHLNILTCSRDCPQRVTVGAPACFIDCTACKTSCKNRIHDCFGFGAVCYDPRFVGGDGVMFYFHGLKDKDFCLVSDRNLHINAHFIGKRPEGRVRDYTWVQSLGIIWDSYSLVIGAKKVGVWDDSEDQIFITLNGIDISIPQKEGALWSQYGHELAMERTSATNSMHVMIDQLMEVSISVVPISKKESRVHNYQITDDDCFAHLHMQFNFFNLSAGVHGVLGQTYQSGFQTPVNTKAPMPVMKGDEQYLTSSLTNADCSVSRFSDQFAAATSLPEEELLTTFFNPVRCSSSATGIMSCRR